MKKKVIAGLGIIIVIGAVAGGIFLFRGKGEDNSVNAEASMETSSTMETEQEDKEESMESETAEPESVDEPENLEDQEYKAALETPEDITSQNEIDEAEVELVGAEAPNVSESDINPLNTTMYSRGTVNVRTGTSSTTAKLGTLILNESVTVTGQSKSTNWYRVTLSDNQTGYVHPDYLSTTKTEVKQPPKQTTNNGNTGTTENKGTENNNNNGNTSNETDQSQNNSSGTVKAGDVITSASGNKIQIVGGDGSMPMGDGSGLEGVDFH